MTTTKQPMLDRIRRHGEQLLRLFPAAKIQDPDKLCRKLRTLETRAHAVAVRLCSGPEYAPDEADRILDTIASQVDTVLGNQPSSRGAERVPVFINRDPRGYALKIDDQWMAAQPVRLHSDWGGYGILAPDLSDND